MATFLLVDSFEDKRSFSKSSRYLVPDMIKNITTLLSSLFYLCKMTLFDRRSSKVSIVPIQECH